MRAIDEIGLLHYYCGILVPDFLKSYLTSDCEYVFRIAHLLRELNFFIEIKQHTWVGKIKALLWQAQREPNATTSRGWEQCYARTVSGVKTSIPPIPT